MPALNVKIFVSPAASVALDESNEQSISLGHEPPSEIRRSLEPVFFIDKGKRAVTPRETLASFMDAISRNKHSAATLAAKKETKTLKTSVNAIGLLIAFFMVENGGQPLKKTLA